MTNRTQKTFLTGRHIPLLLASFALIGCGQGLVKSTNPDVVKTDPTTAKVVRQDLTGYAFFDGKVFTPPTATGIVLAPSALPVSEILTTVGRRVNRGEILIKLAMPNAKSAIEQAEANLRSAQSAYAVAKAGYEGPVRDAQRALSEARAAEKAARLDVQNGGVADVNLAAEARVAATESLRMAQAEMNSNLVPERQAIAAATEYLKEVRAGAQISNARAPIAGTVMSIEAKVGVVTTAKQALATVVDLGALRVQGIVPPQHKDIVKRDTKILIALEGADSDPFEGIVKEVSVLPPSEGQTSAGYLAVIDFNNEKMLVNPGTKIKRLGVKTGFAENALVVPVGAISQDKDKRLIVYIQRGTEWVATPVETGISDGALVAIKSGVSEGDIVRVGSVIVSP